MSRPPEIQIASDAPNSLKFFERGPRRRRADDWLFEPEGPSRLIGISLPDLWFSWFGYTTVIWFLVGGAIMLSLAGPLFIWAFWLAVVAYPVTLGFWVFTGACVGTAFLLQRRRLRGLTLETAKCAGVEQDCRLLAAGLTTVPLFFVGYFFVRLIWPILSDSAVSEESGGESVLLYWVVTWVVGSGFAVCFTLLSSVQVFRRRARRYLEAN